MSKAIFYKVAGRSEGELTDSVISIFKNINKVYSGYFDTILTERFLHSSVVLEKDEIKDIFGKIDEVIRERKIDEIYSFSGMFDFNPKAVNLELKKTIIFNYFPNKFYADKKEMIEASDQFFSSVSQETSIPTLIAQNRLDSISLIPDVSFYNETLSQDFINEPGIDENTIVYVSNNVDTDLGELDGLDHVVTAYHRAFFTDQTLKLICIIQNTDALAKAREIISSIQNSHGIPGKRPKILLTANLKRFFVAETFKRAKLVVLPWAGFNFDFYRKAANMCGTPVVIGYSPDSKYINDLILYRDTSLKKELDQQYLISLTNILTNKDIKNIFKDDLKQVVENYTAEAQAEKFKEIING